MGRMMGMIGGRLGAYRTGLAGDGLRDALVRNVYRGKAPADAALTHVEAELRALRDSLAAMPTTAILAGELHQ
jgi:cytochrome b pre-mRNA-processing protein 3